MSLVVWLPLTKDLRQQGLSDVTATNNGATFNSAGKLGGCYSFDGSDDFISLSGSTLYDIIKGGSAPFSIAMWVYHADSTRAILFGDYSLSGAINFNIELNTSHSVRFYWAGSPDTSGGHTLATLSTWTHIAIIYDGTKINFYMNGELKDTYTGVLSAKTKTSGMYYIGRDSRTGTTAFNGKLNDFRIYDHALSQMEVKELAKGLVLHYPLNRQGWGQENLDNFRSYTNNWTMESLSGSNYTDSTYGNVIKLTTSAVNQRMYHNVTSTLWQSGQVYTVSFLAKADINGRTCNMSRSIADFSPTFTLTTDWKRYSGQITSTATPGGGTLSFRIIQSGATIYITQIKLEKGEMATPYCPGSTDPDYTTMGLNSTTEYDCSGFCNNGTRTGTFTWTSDTPKYQVSTSAQGSSGAKIIGPGMSAEAKSAAIWVKCAKTVNSVFFADKNSTLECGLLNSLIYANTTNSAGFTTTHWKDNQWNHVVVVNDNGTRRVYVNGESETASGANNYYMHTTDAVYLWTRSDNNSYPFNGQMSDFRIYATALSADDVKSLYQNCATIDPDGTIRGQIRS